MGFGRRLNLESLDNAVSPSRLDQLLWPTYQADVAAGRLDAQATFQLLGCFALKLCEIVPAFSRRITRFHRGLFICAATAMPTEGSGEDGLDLDGRCLLACPDTRARSWPLPLGTPEGCLQPLPVSFSSGEQGTCHVSDASQAGLLSSASSSSSRSSGRGRVPGWAHPWAITGGGGGSGGRRARCGSGKLDRAAAGPVGRGRR
ncbi:MAG: hypothetical protein HYV63_25225 [Candidatus Schekmanbacteria bacterium]|nr:hypothetical protein [Candidatus Schekmanbacteria bacterium]